MKTINVTFEDEEYEMLTAIKMDENWRNFILTLVQPKKKKECDINGKTKKSVSKGDNDGIAD